MIQRIVRKALWGLFFFAFFEKFFVPILTSGGLAAVSSSFFAALYSAFGKYDVVHIHAEGPAFFSWLPKMFGKRVVVTIHGIDWQREKWKSGFGSKFIRQGEKNAVKYADEIVVLWLSDIEKSNDYQECMVCREYVNKGIKEYLKNDKKAIKAWEEWYKVGIQTSFQARTFGVCFSESKDQLSQWRGYAQNGMGMAIGFDKNILDELNSINKYDIAFGKVLYNDG